MLIYSLIIIIFLHQNVSYLMKGYGVDEEWCIIGCGNKSKSVSAFREKIS